jgi:hypothetical protein
MADIEEDAVGRCAHGLDHIVATDRLRISILHSAQDPRSETFLTSSRNLTISIAALVWVTLRRAFEQ